MAFVLIYSFDNYIKAHIAMGVLKEQGIDCWLKDENVVTIDPLLSNAVGGIKLMVAKEQAQQAIDILKELS